MAEPAVLLLVRTKKLPGSKCNLPTHPGLITTDKIGDPIPANSSSGMSVVSTTSCSTPGDRRKFAHPVAGRETCDAAVCRSKSLPSDATSRRRRHFFCVAVKLRFDMDDLFSLSMSQFVSQFLFIVFFPATAVRSTLGSLQLFRHPHF